MVDFNIISLDVTLLGSQFNASNGIGASAFSGTSTASSRGPAVITPWDQEDDRSLRSRYNEIRSKSTFINENTSAVREAGLDKDNRALFTLYSALNDLKTIAEYAKSPTTSLSLLAGLNDQFTSGLAEIDEYVRQAELDKLILMAGEKKSYVTSKASLGKTDRDVNGGIVAISATAEIASLTGNEVFTINLSDGVTAGDDITINLSEISGTISLSSIKDLVNTKISELNFINGNGQTESTYKTRIQIEEIEDGKYGFRFAVDGVEKVKLTAASAEPTIIVAGTSKSGAFGSITTGTISEYSDLSGTDPSRTYSHEIVGIDSNGFVIPAEDEDGEPTNSTAIKFETTPVALEIDSSGNSYVLGTTQGDFGNQINGAQTSDVFLSKYDSVGNLLWSRLVGASDEAEAFDLAIDGDDNVIIAGKTTDELVSSDVFTGTDSFVTKYSNSGEELWTRQLDTITTDQANGLAVDANGDVYVTGQISGRFDITTTHNGGNDAYVVKLGGTSGVTLETTQFGTGSNDYGQNIAIANDGNILVVAEEDGNAVLRKLDKDNLDTVLSTQNLGDLGGGSITGLTVDGSDVYISGSTFNGSLNGGSVGNAYNGGKDGFVAKLTDNGGSLSTDWVSYLGSNVSDDVSDLEVHNGSVYISGTTGGVLTGQSKTGITDGYTAKINASTGAVDWYDQHGGEIGGYNGATALAVDANGSSVLDKLGLPSGVINATQTRNVETQTSLRAGDHFYVSVNGGRDIKITINDGDTFDTLATRINTVSARNLKASVTIGEDGSALKIEARNGAEIDLIAGEDGRDALKKLGIEERSILSNEVLFDLNDEFGSSPDKLGGVFALNLNNAFSFSTRQEAEYIFNQLENAIQVIQSAHRSLTFDPIKAQLLEEAKKNIGPAPAHLQDRLARYQDGLQRVLAVTGGTVI